MLSIFLSMVGLALLDSLNLVTISTMAILLTLLVDKRKSLYYVFSTIIAYSIGGMLFFLGIDQFLISFFERMFADYVFICAIILIVIASCMIAGGIYLGGKAIVRMIKKQPGVIKIENIKIKGTTPLALILLGIMATMSDIITSFPVVSFAAVLSANHIPTGIAAIFILSYSFIYATPMFLLYSIYKVFGDEKFNVFQKRFKGFLSKVSSYFIALLLIGFGIALLIHEISMI
ncbi:MAG: hypothetical protein RRY79_01705 [Clostridia bacterium]